jgi:hypothetical protein
MSTDRGRNPAGSPAREASPLTIRHIRHASPEVEPSVFVANADDEAAPVGRFHYAAVIRSCLRILTTWRVSSDDPSVLDRVAELLGGTSPEFDGNSMSLTTNATIVEIALVRSADAVRLSWSRDARRTCDGRIQGDHDDFQPCVCPPSLAERRIATRHGRGCEPTVAVGFRLLQAPAIGSFTFASGSWPLAEDATRAVGALRAYGEPVRAQLRLHRVPYTIASGQAISCTTPRLTVLGPVDQRSALM